MLIVCKCKVVGRRREGEDNKAVSRQWAGEQVIERVGESLTWCQRANAASGWQMMWLLTQVQTKNDGTKRGWLCRQAGKADATISL